MPFGDNMAVNVTGGALEFDAVINTAQFKAQLDAIEKKLAGLTETTNKQAQSVEDFSRRAASAVAGFLSIDAASNFVRRMVEVRGEFQQLEVAFKTMLGSKEKSDKLLQEATKLASVTPFSLRDVASGAKQLLAYGFASDVVVDNLKMLGDIASGVSTDLNGLVYLYGTLKTSGRVTIIDLQQFAGRGVPIFETLSKQLNVTTAEIRGLVSAGKIGFPEVEQAFKTMTSEGGMFFNLMEEQSKTLTGQISNLGDSFDQMLNNLGKSSEGVLGTSIQLLNSLVQNYETVIDIIKFLIATYGTYRAALIVVNVLEGIRASQVVMMNAGLKALTVAEYLHYTALVLVEKAQKLLNATMLSNPYVAITAIIGGLAAALLIWGNRAKETATKEQLLADASAKLADSYNKQEAAIRPYISILKDANSTEQQRMAAYNELLKIDPKIVDGINARSISTQKLTENVEAYINSLRRKMKLEANDAAIQNSLKEETRIQNEINKAQEALAKGTQLGVGSFGSTRVQQEKALKGVLEGQNAALKKQQEITSSLTKDKLSLVGQDKKGAEEVKKTNAELIQEATTLDRIKKVREDIEKQYTAATTQEQRETLTKDIVAADKKIKQLDIYGGIKKSAKSAASESNKLKDLLEKLTELEFKSSEVAESKSSTAVSRMKDEVAKLLEEAKKLKVGEGVILRIERAGKILVDDAVAKNAAQDIANKLSSELSKINIDLFQSTEGSGAELELKKQAVDKETEIEIQGLKARYSNEVSSQQALQDKILEVKAKADQEKRRMDEDYQKKLLDFQLEQIKLGQIELNRQYELIINNPNSSQLDKLEAQEKILNNNASAVQRSIDLVEKFGKSGKINIVYITKLLQDLGITLDDINDEKKVTGWQKFYEQMNELSGTISSIGSSIQGLASDLGQANSELGSTVAGLGQLVSAVGKIAGQLGKKQSTGESVSTAISGVVQLIGLVVSASQQRKLAEQEFYSGITNQQRQYNLALQESILLNAELADNIFLTDYKRRLEKSIEATLNAQREFNRSLEELENGQAKVDQKNAISGGSVLAGVGSGAATGAAIGGIAGAGVFSVPAAIVGGVIGAVVGGIVGLFGGKKKKDVYEDLLRVYPDLVRETADGVVEVNKELAESLIANNRVSDATKELIQDTLNWGQEVEKAAKVIKDVMYDLTGNLGNDLRDALVNAFQDGTDSAVAFAQSVEKTLNNMLSQLLFSQVFGGAFDALEKRMEDSFKSNGDKNWADDLMAFFQDYSGLAVDFNEQLQKARDEAEKYGLDLFKNPNAQAGGNTLAGAIKGMTEQQAELLAGQFGGLRMTAIQQLQVMNNSLIVFNRIEANTFNLVEMRSILRSINNNGVKIIK